MRLWTVHPKYLDRQGLLALWREGLLAQKVLSGQTKGYVHHPQLQRFRAARHPAGAIATFLTEVAVEATARGYNFDRSKIGFHPPAEQIQVTTGHVEFERLHLLSKLQTRDPARAKRLEQQTELMLHPLFEAIPGLIEAWEKSVEPSPDQLRADDY